MIAGSTEIDRGEITSTGTISWPVGFRGSFHPDLSGAQNTRFVARVYGVDTDELLDFVGQVSPRVVLLGHGEEDARQWFEQQIKVRWPKIKVIQPQPGLSVEV